MICLWLRRKKRKHPIQVMNQVTNTRVLLLTRHNTGFVSLPEKKRMNTKIKIRWIFKCILTLVYAGIIYWESSKDTSFLSLPYHTDKFVHFFEFGLLCLTICWSLSSARIGIKGIYKIILAIGITSLYGISDEFHQSFTPHRSVDGFDWLADTAGGGASSLFLEKFNNKHRKKKKKHS